MLRNFLWLFPLKSGVYFIALLSVFASCGLMLTDVRFLQHSGINQGNIGFAIFFLLFSLLLVNGVYQESYKMLSPWLVVQAIGTIEGFIDSLLQLRISSFLVITTIIEVYCWICVLSLYRKFKQNVVRDTKE